ncbi:recombinase family protein [Egicoccus halophilus]|uniref:Site-specific DNA recombinase n=1 Tax=Egicoccus halophilus TaxID=1670830 RepID=A0A8J3ESE4_9ACTN|nr:recombinase family protein [Egicoccus halophilus]GGI07213.1 hypothetical protein GCM10011354_22960 [Egicoccus halophilus]
MASIRAGIYVRISQDRDGTQLGVERQREDCARLVQREGWEVGEVYVENDTSASGKKPREQYQRMMDDLARGRIQAVVAWHADRLHRQPRELEDFIEAIEASGAAVRTVTAGDLDLSTSAGRLLARMLGSVARHESERHAERVSRKMLELTKAGKYTGGSRLFGYHTGLCCPGPDCTKPDARVHGPRRSATHEPCGCAGGGCRAFDVVPEEAAAIREAARLLLAGSSLFATSRWLNEQGFRTTSGSRWSTDGLKRTITNPRLSGQLVYKGEVIGDAPWEPILDRAAHEQLKVRFAPAKRSRPARSRLLTGIAVCGICGARLVGSYNARRVPIYRCPPEGDQTVRENWRGCGGVSIVGPQTDDEIRDRLLSVLEGDGLTAAMAAASATRSGNSGWQTGWWRTRRRWSS